MERKRPGDRLSAADVNELADGVAIARSISGPDIATGPTGTTVHRAPPASQIAREPAVIAQGANVGASDLKAYAPCTLYYHVFWGAEAQYKRVLQIRAPAAGDEGWFGICAEPIAQGSVGRVYVVGCCLARVKNPDSCDYAEIVAGEDYLQGVPSGSAQLIWQDTVDQGDGVYLAVVRFPVAAGPQIQQMKVVAEFNDHLTCHTWDGTSEGTDAIHVAKPPTLRLTPYDGQTVNGITYNYTGYNTRTAENEDEETEDQQITPDYAAGDVIFAVKNIAGGTGATDDEYVDCEWLDLNVDGRAWAKVPE